MKTALRPFNVFVNTGSYDFYQHDIVVRARDHGEALDQALFILDIPFDCVVSASATPQKDDTEFHGIRGCGNKTFKELAFAAKRTNVRAKKAVRS